MIWSLQLVKCTRWGFYFRQTVGIGEFVWTGFDYLASLWRKLAAKFYLESI
jgi:hypothetical protein